MGFHLTKIRAGLYESPTGHTIEHRPDMDGAWYVTQPGASFPDDVYATLTDVRDALRQAAQAAAVETPRRTAEAVMAADRRNRRG